MSPDNQDKFEQLENVLRSRVFQGSENLRAFLRYVVTKTVDQDAGSLKEYTIACDVFGQDNYDPRIDSTVRVQAGRLRNKLQEYYSTEGRQDHIIIELPKGHYTPTFSYVERPDTLAPLPSVCIIEGSFPTNGAAAAEEVAVPPQESVGARSLENLPAEEKRPRWPVPVVASGLLLGVVVLWLSYVAVSYRAEAQQWRALTSTKNSSAEWRALSVVWGEFLSSPQPILVSYSNALFERRPDHSLKSMRPLAPGKAEESVAASASEPTNAEVDVIDYYTGVGEVMGASSLSKFFTQAGHSFRVKRSLLLNWDDVKTENVVMLGSPAENLLLRSLPQAQDFEFRYNNELRLIELINLRPQPGEESIYRPKFERVRDQGSITLSVSEDYALISLIKGLGEQNKLLILAGITTHGTHAAAEYMTKPEYAKELLNHLNASAVKGSAPPGSYQVVLKVKVNGGVPIQVSYVTHHVLNN
ncbi:MAG: hypothetical protein WKF84_09995 [Pyrinomonadaceae bacterium]